MNLDFFSVSIAGLIIVLLVAWSLLFCKRYASIIILGMAVRIFLIYIHEITRLFGDLDIVDYLQYFLMFRESLQTDLSPFLQPHVWFSTLLYSGWIFAFVGEPGLWVIRLANAAMGVAVIAPLNSINQHIFNKKLSKLQACLIVFWPTWIRYNVEVGRTAPSVLAVVITLAGLFAILKFPKPRWNLATQVTTATFFVLSCLMRVHYIAYFIPIISLFFLVQISRAKMSPYLRWMLYFIASGLTVAIFAGFLGLYQVLSVGNFSADVLTSEDGALDYARMRDEGDSAYLSGIFPRNTLDWLWFAPLQGFYFMFSPMPWDAHSAFAAGSSVQAWFLLIFCLIALNKSRKNIGKNASLKLLFTSLLFTSLTFGAFTKNAGGAERWRLPSTLILIPTPINLIQLAKREKHEERMRVYS